MKTNMLTFPKEIFSIDVAGFIGLSDEDSYSGKDLLDAEDVGAEQAVANGNRIAKRYNMHDVLVKTVSDLKEMLDKGEDIISGIEAEADNKGIDLTEARHWWVDARKLLDEIEDQQNAVD